MNSWCVLKKQETANDSEARTARTGRNGRGEPEFDVRRPRVVRVLQQLTQNHVIRTISGQHLVDEVPARRRAVDNQKVLVVDVRARGGRAGATAPVKKQAR